MIRRLLLLAVSCSLTCVLSAKDYYLHSWKRVELSQEFHSEGANFGDFNRDGKMDIVSGPFWYEGPEFKTKHEYYPGKPFDPKGYSENFLAFTHDFNKDQWPDILIIGFPGKETWWFENPKGQEQAWVRHVALAITDNESPAFGDLTGDGKPELICSSEGYFGYAEPDWSKPDQPWKFHRITPKGPWQRFTHGMGYGDVDGDGRMDLLEKDGWWRQPESLAGDPEWKKNPANFGTGGAQMYAYDVDGDGDNDVITSLAAHAYGLAWFENRRENGAITFQRHIIMNKEPAENRYGVKFSQLHAIDLIDMDGDGLKDIVTGKRWWAHGPTGDAEPNAPPVLYWFKLVRGADKSVDFIPYQIDDNSGIGTQVIAGHIQGRKKFPDVVVGNKKGTFVLLHTAEKVKKKEWEKNQPKPVEGSSEKQTQ